MDLLFIKSPKRHCSSTLDYKASERDTLTIDNMNGVMISFWANKKVRHTCSVPEVQYMEIVVCR